MAHTMDTMGYAGSIARIDLGKRSVSLEDVRKYARGFLGGRGVNAWLLYRDTHPHLSILDPRNPILLGSGPLVGTLAPSGARLSVDSRNAFNGGIGSSNCGGHFAPALKYAGFDHVLIFGRSVRPCYVYIQDGELELRDAETLWGKTTWETETLIREKEADDEIQVLTIGPAGEHLVNAACLITNRARAAGRCGIGAIMGSKNLKAIAVKGTRGITVARPEEFQGLVDDIRERIERNPVMSNLRRWGSMKIPELNQAISANPVRNFQDGFWDEEKVEKTNAEQLMNMFLKRTVACFGCPVACSHILEIGSGRYAGEHGEGFPCNHLHGFGYKLDVSDLPAIVHLYFLCSQYGLDVDNAGGVIAWAMECYEKGILTLNDTDGLDLRWGNHDVVEALLRKMAYREGFGNLLAQGSQKASRIIGKGSERFAITIKGQELYETLRTTVGWALGAILSPRGGGHLRGAPIYEFPYCELGPAEGKKWFGSPAVSDRRTYRDKAKLVIYFENLKAMVDCMGVCYFPTQWYSPELMNPDDLHAMFSAATGLRLTFSAFTRAADRVVFLERAFNLREGITISQDWPPERFFDPVPSGPSQGDRLDRVKLRRAIHQYYRLRGWNPSTGRPTKKTVRALGFTETDKGLYAIRENQVL